MPTQDLSTHGSSAPPYQHGRIAPQKPPRASNTTKQTTTTACLFKLGLQMQRLQEGDNARDAAVAHPQRIGFTPWIDPVQQKTMHINGTPTGRVTPLPLPPTNHQWRLTPDRHHSYRTKLNRPEEHLISPPRRPAEEP
jgi:hypothetical protein